MAGRRHLFFFYSWLTFTLRRFPYTRPWGESLRSLPAESTVAGRPRDSGCAAGPVHGAAHRADHPVRDPHRAVALSRLRGRPHLAAVGLSGDGAADAQAADRRPVAVRASRSPTRTCPAANLEAFKGMSVFVGLVVSLGSSGIVNQVMSGFTLTYSRALRVGDFVDGRRRRRHRRAGRHAVDEDQDRQRRGRHDSERASWCRRP